MLKLWITWLKWFSVILTTVPLMVLSLNVTLYIDWVNSGALSFTSVTIITTVALVSLWGCPLSRPFRTKKNNQLILNVFYHTWFLFITFIQSFVAISIAMYSCMWSGSLWIGCRGGHPTKQVFQGLGTLSIYMYS